MTEGVAELFLRGDGDMGCIVTNASQSTCFRDISDVCSKEHKAVSAVASRFAHHPTILCCFLEGVHDNTDDMVKESVGKHTTKTLIWMEELGNWHEGEEEEHIVESFVMNVTGNICEGYKKRVSLSISYDRDVCLI